MARVSAGVLLSLLVAWVVQAEQVASEVSLYDQARRLAASGRPKQAIEVLDRAASAGLRTPALYNLRAQLRASLSDWDGAERDYQRAAQLDPSDVHSRLSLGKLYQSRGLWSQAVTCYREILILTPRNADAVLGLAQAYEMMGRAVAAQNLLRSASTVISDSRIHERLARMAMAAGNAKDAEAALDRLASSVEGKAKRDALIRLAELRLSAGRLDEAMDVARQALAMERPSGALSDTTYDVMALATDAEVRQVSESIRALVDKLERKEMTREEVFTSIEGLQARLARAERTVSELAAPGSRREAHVGRLFAYALALEAAVHALTFVDVGVQGQREMLAARLEAAQHEMDRLVPYGR